MPLCGRQAGEAKVQKISGEEGPSPEIDFIKEGNDRRSGRRGAQPERSQRGRREGDMTRIRQKKMPRASKMSPTLAKPSKKGMGQ